MQNHKNNLPTKKLSEMDSATVQGLVANVKELYDKGKPETDEEVAQRIDEFFGLCERTSLRPGIETLCMALHISRQTLLNWSRGDGCSRERKELINGARSFIHAFLEQASLSGKLNPATSIFLLKNWCGYRDTVIYQAQTNDLLPSERAEIIAQRRHLLGGDTMPEKPL